MIEFSKVDQQLAESLAAVGVNRVSLGAQSFRTPKLQVLERDHRADDLERACAVASSHRAYRLQTIRHLLM